MSNVFDYLIQLYFLNMTTSKIQMLAKVFTSTAWSEEKNIDAVKITGIDPWGSL